MRVLTIEQLKRKKACPHQIALFKQLFGNRVVITEKKCLAYWNKFQFNWAASNFLTLRQYRKYARDIGLAEVKYNNSVLDSPAEKRYLRLLRKERAKAFGRYYQS